MIENSKAIPSYPLNAALMSSPIQSIFENQKRLQAVTANPLTATVADLIAAHPKVTTINEAIAKLALGKMESGEWAKWYATHEIK